MYMHVYEWVWKLWGEIVILNSEEYGCIKIIILKVIFVNADFYLEVSYNIKVKYCETCNGIL